jgi:hypothetical protein
MSQLSLFDRYACLTIAALLVFGRPGCASVPPPKPLEKSRSIVAIEITVRTAIRFITYHPDKVYFVRVNDSDNVFLQDRVIPSNYDAGGYYYVVNARPGRYAAVATWRLRKSHPQPVPGSYAPVDTTVETFTVFLSKDAIRMTEINVPPSSIVFSGSLVVDLTFSGPDDAQSHYAKIITPRGGSDVFELLWSDEHDFVENAGPYKFKNDRTNEREFLADAAKIFKDTEWLDLVKQRIRELDSSPPP